MEEKNKNSCGERKNSYLCGVNRAIDYPGRIPRGQDYIDTTHQKLKPRKRLFLVYRK